MIETIDETIEVERDYEREQVREQIEAENGLATAGRDIGSSQLYSGAGTVECAFEDLRQVPVPAKDDTYTPVGHADMVENLYATAEEVMAPKGYRLEGQRYLLSHSGERMFFVHRYSSDDSEMGLALAGRNSYDKYMKLAFALGAQVFNCDNLCLNGDLAVSRRHTGDVSGFVKEQMILQMFRASLSWRDMVASRDAMARIPLFEEEGYELMGVARTRTIDAKAPARRLLATAKEWKSVARYWKAPQHDYTGGARTLWAWYNSLTQAYRDLKPADQLPRHASLHRFATEVIAENG